MVMTCIFFLTPQVQITKDPTGYNQWPVCDLSLIWWCDHCFWAAAFHRCLPAAQCSVAAFVPLTLYLILSVRVSGMRLFPEFYCNNYSCLCAFCFEVFLHHCEVCHLIR